MVIWLSNMMMICWRNMMMIWLIIIPLLAFLSTVSLWHCPLWGSSLFHSCYASDRMHHPESESVNASWKWKWLCSLWFLVESESEFVNLFHSCYAECTSWKWTYWFWFLVESIFLIKPEQHVEVKMWVFSGAASESESKEFTKLRRWLSWVQCEVQSVKKIIAISILCPQIPKYLIHHPSSHQSSKHLCSGAVCRKTRLIHLHHQVQLLL